MANDTYVLDSFTLQDKYGTKTQTLVPAYVDSSSITFAHLIDQWVAVGGDLDAITDAQIVGGKITIVKKPEGGWKSTPGANSFVERNGMFNFGNATTRYKYGIRVPSFDESKIANGKIDLTDVDVAALITLLTSTYFTGGVFTNEGLYALTALVDAFLGARKYRRQLDRSTYEPGA